jgi:hypothetical protein
MTKLLQENGADLRMKPEKFDETVGEVAYSHATSHSETSIAAALIVYGIESIISGL